MNAPERIWMARAWAETFTAEDDRENIVRYILATPAVLADQPEVRELVDSAVKAERERAAKVAESRIGDGWDAFPPGHPYDKGYIRAAQAIAAAIRATPAGDGEGALTHA